MIIINDAKIRNWLLSDPVPIGEGILRVAMGPNFASTNLCIKWPIVPGATEMTKNVQTP